MEVKYIGESGTFKSVKGQDVKLENSGVYKCMEKEYHSGLFVRLVLTNGEHVKVKRKDLQKV